MKDNIFNRDRFNQKVLFKGTEVGKFAPSDMDCVYEIQGKYYIVVEIKSNQAQLPYGQQLTLTRTIDAVKKGGYKEAVMVVARHSVPTNKDVYLKDTLVDKFYIDGKWVKVEEDVTFIQWLGMFAKFHKIDILKEYWC